MFRTEGTRVLCFRLRVQGFLRDQRFMARVRCLELKGSMLYDKARARTVLSTKCSELPKGSVLYDKGDHAVFMTV